jgi:hypothetical protein
MQRQNDIRLHAIHTECHENRLVSVYISGVIQ